MTQTFLQRSQPVDLSSFNERSASFGGAAVLPSSMNAETNKGRIQDSEKVRHFTYWNFVAISYIANSFKAMFPNVGRIARQGAVQQGRLVRSSIDRKQRDHIRQTYGRLRFQNEDDWRPLPDEHILVQRLQRPNQDDTWGELIYETIMYWYLTAEFYWWLIPMRGGFSVPAEIHVVPTDWVERVYSRSGTLITYKIHPKTARPWDIPPEEMVSQKFKSPLSKLNGWGVLDAIPRWINNTEFIEFSRSQSFKKGINPSWLIKLSESYGTPDEGDIARLKAKFMARAAGLGKIEEPLVVPPNIDLQPANQTPKDLAYEKSSPEMRDNILGTYGVPSPLVIIGRDVNRDTVENAHAVFCDRTLNPLASDFAGFLETKVTPRFGPGIGVWYDDCRANDWERQLKETELDLKHGALSPDELAVMRDREPLDIPESRSRYIGSGLVPLDPALIDDFGDSKGGDE